MSWKSLERDYLNVMACILADAAKAFPSLSDSLEKDLAHLMDTVSSRGLSVMTIDLPEAGKHLDRCLSEGQFSFRGAPLTKRGAGEVHLPGFLGCLYQLIFCGQTGLLKEDLDVNAIFFLRQILFAFKKVDVPCPEEFVDREIDSFLRVDAVLPDPDSNWVSETASAEWLASVRRGFAFDETIAARAADILSIDALDDVEISLKALDFVSGCISTGLGVYDPMAWSFGNGPGRVANLPREGYKYSLPNWPERLDSAFPQAECAYHSYSAWARHSSGMGGILSYQPKSDHPVASKLVAVPKDLTKPRLIASEPVENMWCQQNLRHYMYDRSEKQEDGQRCWIANFIAFRSQERNQLLALEGSKEGRLATVDLSAASDRLTCLVTELFWRGNLPVLLALRACRTHECETPQGVVQLRKFATMGNACTFPVQSFVFLAIALSAVLSARKMQLNLRNIVSLAGEVAVFGDDIVVPIDCRTQFERLMDLLWFKINDRKTYWTGKFRESCGVDAYAGTSVTPAYYRGPTTEKPEDIAMNVEVSNNFYESGMLFTSAFIARTVPRGFPLVSMSSGVLGFKSRSGLSNEHLRTRWNRLLQRHETRVLGVTAESDMSKPLTEAALLQYFTEAPSAHVMWEGGVRQRPKLTMRWDWVATEHLEGP